MIKINLSYIYVFNIEVKKLKKIIKKCKENIDIKYKRAYHKGMKNLLINAINIHTAETQHSALSTQHSALITIL